MVNRSYVGSESTMRYPCGSEEELDTTQLV
ncbi:MAG: hypothetical protein ACI8Y4_004050 [Candidatus Poriferisodalaceae bacterium]|jgi:hypothetical protein